LIDPSINLPVTQKKRLAPRLATRDFAPRCHSATGKPEHV